MTKAVIVAHRVCKYLPPATIAATYDVSTNALRLPDMVPQVASTKNCYLLRLFLTCCNIQLLNFICSSLFQAIETYPAPRSK